MAKYYKDIQNYKYFQNCKGCEYLHLSGIYDHAICKYRGEDWIISDKYVRELKDKCPKNKGEK